MYIFTGSVKDISDEVLKIATEGIRQDKAVVPPPLCSSYDKPLKEDAINYHRSRFN